MPEAAINSSSFYSEYHGHKIQALERICPKLRQKGEAARGIMWLVGDSTLDNKYWLSSTVGACNGYEKCLRPPQSTPDVAYWLNSEIVRRDLGASLCCVNAAIEESTLGLRAGGNLLPQDALVKRQLIEDDVLVVSCGGNDIALRPTVWTALSMVAILASPKWLIRAGLAPGLGHFVRLFRDQTAAYVESLLEHRKPRCVVACMLYYLDEKQGGSWADGVLSKLGYNTDPSKLQLVMRYIFENATEKIALKCGTPVVAIPLYEALNGKETMDYVQRVEPSSQGGEKMAKLILDRLVPTMDLLAPAPATTLGGAGIAKAPMGDETFATTHMPEAVHIAQR
jgi:hypothetical protein